MIKKAKKLTQSEKTKEIIESAIANIKPSLSVTDCEFVGAKYDAKAVDAIATIASGLVENAKALGKLAEVLSASQVDIEAMIKVNSPIGEAP